MPKPVLLKGPCFFRTKYPLFRADSVSIKGTRRVLEVSPHDHLADASETLKSFESVQSLDALERYLYMYMYILLYCYTYIYRGIIISIKV